MPDCIAIVLCNEIIEDKRTNNKTLVSLFHVIATPVIPASHARMFVMASFAHGEGAWPFAVSLRAPSGGEIIRLQGAVEFPSSEAIVDVVLEFRSFPLAETGTHVVDVVVGEKLLASRDFRVHLLQGE